MGAVDVGVGHEDDLAVAGGLQVEGASAACADHLDDGRALDVAQHVGLGCLLHVEDLAADRQERLELGVAGVLGGSQGGVALDDEQLGGGDVVAAAVGELGRQGGGLQGGLAAGDLLVQARRDAGAHLADDLLLQGARLGLEVPLGGGQQGGELALDHLGDDLAHGPGAQDLLGLALELGLGHAHGDDGGQARHDVVLLDAAVLGGELQGPGVGLDALAQHLGEGLLKSGQVGAAHGGGDDVDEGALRGVVANPPAQRDVDHAGALDLHGPQVPAGAVELLDGLGVGALTGEAEGVSDRAVGGQEVDEVGGATQGLEDLNAVVVAGVEQVAAVLGGVLGGRPQGDLVDSVVGLTGVGGRRGGGGDRLGLGALVLQAQGEARDEEAGLTQAGAQGGGVVLGGLGEDLRVGPVADPGAGHAAAHLADDAQLGGLRELGEG